MAVHVKRSAESTTTTYNTAIWGHMKSPHTRTPNNPTSSIELSPQKLIDRACNETGLNNFYPDAIEAFTQMTQSVSNEIAFSEVGMMAFKEHMHRLLVNHLRIEEELRLHPEILEEDISDPIVILGLPRTGTTKLQRMMSANPNVHKFYFWRLLNPARFPDADPTQPDPRIEVANQTATMLQTMYPNFMAVHPTLPEEVDEDLFLMEFSFKTHLLACRFGVRSYYDWVANSSMHNNYHYLKRIIKYLQWQDGGKKAQPWIMKSPFHSGSLDALLDAYPNATLVHTHRDLTEVLPSFCNMMDACLHLYTDEIDLREIGRFYLEVVSTDMNKYLALRKELGSSINILDVAYKDIITDPMSVVREIYQYAGRPVAEDEEKSMLDWNEQHPKDRFGKNTYTMERYGLTRNTIEAAFPEYIKQFSSLF